jgi:hypothetical protein
VKPSAGGARDKLTFKRRVSRSGKFSQKFVFERKLARKGLFYKKASILKIQTWFPG